MRTGDSGLTLSTENKSQELVQLIFDRLSFLLFHESEEAKDDGHSYPAVHFRELTDLKAGGLKQPWS